MAGQLLGASTFGDDISFGLAEELLEQPLEHLAFYIYGLPQRALPLYHDALVVIATRARAVFGAYANARGLAGFYAVIGRVLNGGSAPGFPSTAALHRWLDHRRGLQPDEALGRPCDFAAGFMTDLSSHRFGAFAPEAIGHSGILGSPFAFHDPTTGLSAAVILNGLSSSPDDLDFIRPAITREIIASVA